MELSHRGRLTMKIMLTIVLAVLISGCSAIAGIFKAGVWVGVILAVVIVVILFAVFGRSRG